MNFTDTKSQIEGIEKIFADAEKEDNWNLDEPMLYSYYFVDQDVDKLEKLGLYLDKQGYDFIDVFELGDEETGESTGENLLHIDKVETHTPQSLAERNVEFAKLAEEYKIVSYDGWEFGEVGVYDEEDDELDDDVIE
ncbi:MAG: ribonuclease E inhibitor RraB [Acidobacteria bacterium]|jgi:regulator of RNase E activity RraB|nr:ribonuclease E inhibitor RraB [Acidobacteriota bacterium]